MPIPNAVIPVTVVNMIGNAIRRTVKVSMPHHLDLDAEKIITVHFSYEVKTNTVYPVRKGHEQLVGEAKDAICGVLYTKTAEQITTAETRILVVRALTTVFNQDFGVGLIEETVCIRVAKKTSRAWIYLSTLALLALCAAIYGITHTEMPALPTTAQTVPVVTTPEQEEEVIIPPGTTYEDVPSKPEKKAPARPMRKIFDMEVTVPPACEGYLEIECGPGYSFQDFPIQSGVNVHHTVYCDGSSFHFNEGPNVDGGVEHSVPKCSSGNIWQLTSVTRDEHEHGFHKVKLRIRLEEKKIGSGYPDPIITFHPATGAMAQN